MTANEVADTEQRTTRTLPTDPVDLIKDVLKHRGWDIRQGQIDMVEQIHQGILKGEGLRADVPVNAPVGTGKTLAYLAVLITMSERAVIATSTKSLQDQIVSEELPELARDLKELYDYDLTFSVLKGKGNYFCMDHLAKAIGQPAPGLAGEAEEDPFGDLLKDLNDEDYKILQEAFDEIREGQQALDITRFDAERYLGRLSNDRLRREVSANHSCPGTASERVDDFDPTKASRTDILFYEARSEWNIRKAAYKHATASKIVVLNTTLLNFEMLRANSPFGAGTALLRGVDSLVIDEAHHLPRIVAEIKSISFDPDVYLGALDAIVKRAKKFLGEKYVLKSGAHEAGYALRNHIWSSMVTATMSNPKTRKEGSQHFGKAYKSAEMGLTALTRDLVEHFEHAPYTEGKTTRSGLPQSFAGMIADAFETWVSTLSTFASMEEFIEGTESYKLSLTIRTEERYDSGERVILHGVPVDISDFRGELLFACDGPNLNLHDEDEDFSLDRHTVILSSGTIDRKIPASIGMKTGSFVNVPSPFDSSRARLYLPTSADIVPPNNPEWMTETVDIAIEAIEENLGSAFVLTTSNKSLANFTEELTKHFTTGKGKNLGITILSQASGRSKAELVREFRSDINSVLIGTTSYWEGVDVPGAACSLVIVDKIPFPTQDDPVFNARREYAKATDGNPFNDVDVSQAGIMIAQAAGRLIRSVNDYGLVMILDERLTSKRYGPAITKLIPGDWPTTSNYDAAMNFLQWSGDLEGEIPEALPKLSRSWTPLRVGPSTKRRRPVSGN